jgi:hypothetical protein
MPYEIPPGFLWRSLNVVDRYGRLRTRQGLSRVAAAGLGSRPTGGVSFKTAGGARLTVAAGTDKWYRLSGGSWVDISGGHAFLADVHNPTRFTMFPSSGTNWIIGVNNADAPYKWDGSAPAAVLVGGTPPVARDITVASNFVVLGNVVESGTRAPSRIRVSDFNDLDTWAQYGPVDLTDTNDDIVAVRALNRTSFAVYKENSVWMGWAELGLFPFRFETMDYQPGPCSPAAVVRFGQVHYYFGIDGRIYRFNGVRLDVVSRAIEYYLQTAGLPTTFRPADRDRCWGVYSAVDRCIWFFLPGPTGADPTVGISLNTDTGAVYPHVFPFPVSAGWEGDDAASISWSDLLIYADWVGGPFEATYPSWDSFGGSLRPATFVGAVSGQIYRQQFDVADDTTPIPQLAEWPLKTWFGMERHTHLDGLETFFAQTAEGAGVRLDIGVSDALGEVLDPQYTTLGVHDTTSLGRQKFNIESLEARFWSIRYAVTSSGPVEFRGGLANGWPQEVPEHGAEPITVIVVGPILVTPTAGLSSVTVTGVFAADYMVAVETSWPTQYGIPEESKTLTSFVIELGTPVPLGGVIRCKVITS